MKVAVFTTNGSFFSPVERAFRKLGHEIQFWNSENGAYNLGRLLSWCDVAFVEFCQDPLHSVVSAMGDHPGVVLTARMHRIEMYNRFSVSPEFPWDRVDHLFVSADHVLDRFMKSRVGVSKPKSITIAPTNIVDPEMFPFVERVWKPPYRLCLVGNFVPKKRQYTAIQYMFDLREKFGDIFRLDILGQRGSWSGYGNPEYYQNCLDLIEDLELKDIVTIYDKIPREEIAGFYAREHAIISNSNEEGTHVSIAEATMTGCIPFVGYWRGAEGVYPKDVAEHFRSPGQFLALCTGLKMRSEADSIQAASKNYANTARKRYGAVGKYESMVRLLEESVEKRAVPEEKKK
jgi:glycosyltransferase involved in cell wall biosynthesis